jgi:hypothetical protein
MSSSPLDPHVTDVTLFLCSTCVSKSLRLCSNDARMTQVLSVLWPVGSFSFYSHHVTLILPRAVRLSPAQPPKSSSRTRHGPPALRSTANFAQSWFHMGTRHGGVASQQDPPAPRAPFFPPGCRINPHRENHDHLPTGLRVGLYVRPCFIMIGMYSNVVRASPLCIWYIVAM